MSLKIKKKRAKILILLGLSCLVTGLYLWTYSSYQNQRDILQNKLNLNFDNITVNLKLDAVQDIIYTFFSDETTQDSINNSILEDTTILGDISIFPKNLMLTSYSSTDDLDLPNLDESSITNFSENLTNYISKNFNMENFNISAISTDIDNVSVEINTNLLNKSTSKYKKKIETFIQKNETLKDLNLLVHSIGLDSAEYITGFTSTSYSDNISLYYISMVHPNLYLLEQIYPEILFSVIIFCIISLTFYYYHHILKQQEGINKLREDFISNITHELKTPVSTIGVALEAITNFGVDNAPKLRKEYINISILETQRLSLLIEKVLDISKNENNPIDFKYEKIDFKILLHEIITSLKLQLEKNSISYDLKEEGEDFHFMGDKSHFTNVIYNLIDNAIKYSGHHAMIQCQLKKSNDTLIFAIKDNGPGIPKKYQQQIFDKFFRVSKDNIHNTKGHGLGLSYVKKIVELHNGSIQLISKENSGSTFILNIPIKIT